MFIKIAVIISQLLNVVFLKGHPDVTVSARCYVNRHKPRWSRVYKIINTLFFFQQNHCRSSFETDVIFARKVVALVDKQKFDGGFW